MNNKLNYSAHEIFWLIVALFGVPISFLVLRKMGVPTQGIDITAMFLSMVLVMVYYNYKKLKK